MTDTWEQSGKHLNLGKENTLTIQVALKMANPESDRLLQSSRGPLLGLAARITP